MVVRSALMGRTDTVRAAACEFLEKEDAEMVRTLCAEICDKRDYRLFGTFFDGKGQPSQVSAVSHGSATTRFDGIKVINSKRKL